MPRKFTSSITLSTLFLLSLSLIGCGGGSDSSDTPEPNNLGNESNSGDNSNNSDNNGGGQSSQLPMAPSTSIEIGRDLNVLILSSHTTDQRALMQDEIDASFALVKEVLEYNQVTNNYSLQYEEYETNMSSQDMLKYYDDNSSDSLYPEPYALSESDWIKEDQNIEKLNNADIIVLRTSFSAENTSGSFWGAATGEAIIWPNLKKIPGLNELKVFLNSPTDPDSTDYPYQHNDQLAEKLKIDRFDRIFAHEFIHALGYGAHDNGVDLYQTETFSEKIKSDLDYSSGVSSTLSYGDCFSVMGNSDCSLMLSPSAKEFLGVSLDSASVYSTNKVELNSNQILKVFLSETTVSDGNETVLNYITLEPPKTQDYGQSLNGDIELSDSTQSLQPNKEGYLVRLVKVNITIEGTPDVILVDAAPPLNNATYTLQAGRSIEIGGRVNISFTAQRSGKSEFDVTYL